jgi:hypothetical protein
MKKPLNLLTKPANSHSAILTSLLLVSLLLLTSCDDSGSDNNSQTKPKPDQTTEKEDPNNYNWTITVNDSSSVAMGSIESTTTLNLTAKNNSKGIVGKYSGTGSGNTVNVNPAYAVSSQAGTGSTLTWDFSIDYPLAPLTKDTPADEDDALASLTPESDPSIALAPLTQEGQETDYEGAGTMTMAARTATIQGAGVSAQKQMDAVTYPFNINIIGQNVRLEVKTPQGSLYFDGTLERE